MRCPQCKCWALKIIETRRKMYQHINKRVLKCPKCFYTFSVTESIDEINIAKKLLQDNETYRLFELEEKLKNAKKK